MKKNLFALLAIIGVMLTLALTSCDSDGKDSPKNNDSETDGKIIGTWVYTEKNGRDTELIVEYTFQSNGRYKLYYFDAYDDESDTIYGEYIIDETGNLFGIQDDGGSRWYAKVKTNGNQMSFTITYQEDTIYFDTDETYILRRK